VVFAGVNRPDRRPEETILTALEAAELELGKVELVVLSACDTGRGQVAGGEGVLGLQRAFQLAGAHSVVANLWKVPDEETHALMTEFYKNLWEKKLPKLEALRQAQLTLLRDHKPGATVARGGMKKKLDQHVKDLQQRKEDQTLPPYYWAAFVLSGDWR
jgi:CHAT domain-containing protein